MFKVIEEQIRSETFLPASYCDEIDHSLRKKIILSEIVDDQVVVICMISSPFFPFTCLAPLQVYFSLSGSFPGFSLLPRERRLEREPQELSSGIPAPLPFVAGIK